MTNEIVIPNPLVAFHERHYGSENVTVVLEWTTPEEIIYNLTVVFVPEVPWIFIERSTVLLTVSCNTVYNITVASRCVQRIREVIQLHYGIIIPCLLRNENNQQSLYPTAVKCDYPVDLPSVVIVTDHSDPALVGSNITLIYPAGDALTRANSTIVITCMANGQWEPNPWNVVTMSNGT